MRTQADVESLIRRLLSEMGDDPADMIQIRPFDGGWEDALSYGITSRDGRQARIYRRDLDDGNEQEMKKALRTFS